MCNMYIKLVRVVVLVFLIYELKAVQINLTISGSEM